MTSRKAQSSPEVCEVKFRLRVDIVEIRERAYFLLVFPIDILGEQEFVGDCQVNRPQFRSLLDIFDLLALCRIEVEAECYPAMAVSVVTPEERIVPRQAETDHPECLCDFSAKETQSPTVASFTLQS